MKKPGSGARRAPMVAAALILVTLAALQQSRIDAAVRGRATTSPLLYLPSGKYLKTVSLGFNELVADVLYIWSIQYYGNYRIEDRYEYLEHIFKNIITELDPHYLDAYLTGSLIMSTEARRPDLSLALLDKGIWHNPDAWILAFDAGYLCYHDLKDYPRAAGYFEQALKSPSVHPQVKRFYAEMRNLSGDKRTALREWALILESAEDGYVRTVAWNHVHDLKVQVDLEDLQAAIDSFRVGRGRPPLRLSELPEAAMAPGLPIDPEGDSYSYDQRTGRVHYAKSRVLGR